MPRYLILFAGLLLPVQAMAADAGTAQGFVKVTGYVPASCRLVEGASGSEPSWSCNTQSPTTLSQTDSSVDTTGTTVTRYTVQPVV